VSQLALLSLLLACEGDVRKNLIDSAHRHCPEMSLTAEGVQEAAFEQILQDLEAASDVNWSVVADCNDGSQEVVAPSPEVYSTAVSYLGTREGLPAEIYFQKADATGWCTGAPQALSR